MACACVCLFIFILEEWDVQGEASGSWWNWWDYLQGNAVDGVGSYKNNLGNRLLKH